MSPRTAAHAVIGATAPAPVRRRPDEVERPPLRVVEPPRRPRLRPGRVGTIAGVLLFAALFGLVAFQTVLIKAQAQIDTLGNKVAAQEERHRDLGLQLAELQSPERVIDAAKERLGMIEPGSVEFLRPSADDDARSAYDPDAGSSPPATTASSSKSGSGSSSSSQKSGATGR